MGKNWLAREGQDRKEKDSKEEMGVEGKGDEGNRFIKDEIEGRKGNGWSRERLDTVRLRKILLDDYNITK